MSTITEGYLDAPVFKLVSDVAADLGVRAFVIGGYVRDCFLGRPNTDIDIVVEGSGIALAEAVAEKVHTNVSVFKNFEQKALFERLKGQGEKLIFYIPASAMTMPDGETTADTIHLTDLGMQRYVDLVLPVIRKAMRKAHK